MISDRDLSLWHVSSSTVDAITDVGHSVILISEIISITILILIPQKIISIPIPISIIILFRFQVQYSNVCMYIRMYIRLL